VKTVDTGNGSEWKEVQWCEHLEVETGRCRGYGIVQILNMSNDLVVGKGIVRVTCKACTPKLLAQLFNASLTV